jgi:hypothetical protein
VSATKRSIVKVMAGSLCLTHALIIAMAKVNGDPNYKSYRDGYCLKQHVQYLLSVSGVKLTNGRGLKELKQFQNYFSDYKIIVYDSLCTDRALSCVNSLSNKKLYLLYDSGHYNIITNLKATMTKRYM